MKLLKSNKKYIKMMLAAAALMTVGGCNLMHDDMPPCATDPKVSVVVNFVYDYNMDDEDRFDSEVGSVFLYVFEEDSTFVNRFEKRLIDIDTEHPDFSMTFDANDNNDIEMGKTYHFVAVASSKATGYDDSQDTPGFKLVNEMIPGRSKLGDYILRLNRDDKMFSDFDFGVIDYRSDYSGPDAMIDTVWTPKPGQVQTHTIPYLKADFDSAEQIPDHVEEVKIPMMRVTNSIEVALTSPNFTAMTQPTDYDILIYFPEGNGVIDFEGRVGQVHEISQPLYYRALRKRVGVYEEKTSTRADGDTQYAIYATFGVSRLRYEDGSSLQILDPETHEVLARIDDFSNYLNDRGNTDDNYTPQEYLDREFNFKVDLGLTADNSLWWSQVIGIHGWAVRDWYIGLH